MHAEIVDEIARLKVVGAVEHERRAGEQFRDIVCGEVGDDAADFYARVGLAQAGFGGDGLGKALGGVALGEERLALKVTLLHEVAVNDDERADAGARDERRLAAAERAASDDCYARCQELVLSGFADAAKENLPGIALVVCRVHTLIIEQSEPRP